MRTSAIVSVSLPPVMARESERAAHKKHMTRSELVRVALRHYLEELHLEEAIRIADEELRTGKVKVLPPGGLAHMLRG